MLIIPNITIESVIKWMISQVSDGNNSANYETSRLFYLPDDYELFIFTQIFKRSWAMVLFVRSEDSWI